MTNDQPAPARRGGNGQSEFLGAAGICDDELDWVLGVMGWTAELSVVGR